MFNAKRKPSKHSSPTSPTFESNFPKPAPSASLPLRINDEPEDTIVIPQAVTEVMSVIKLNWEFMHNPDFNPIAYALSLLDENGGLGNDYNRFVDVYESVDKAMDMVVNGNSF